jgi:WD40 repeat protein
VFQVDVILRLLLWDWRETLIDGNITCLSYAPNCDIIAAGCGSGTLFFINAQTGEKILCPVTVHTREVVGVAFSEDGQWLIAGFPNGIICLLDAHPRGGTVVSAV